MGYPYYEPLLWFMIVIMMEELMSKKLLFSGLDIFGLKMTQKEDNKPVVCRLCQLVVLAQDGNTSNLFSHLKIHHAKD